MPPAVKPHRCVVCDEEDASMFYGGRKTLCKRCIPKDTKETRPLVLLKYKCLTCGNKDKDNFNLGYKSRCKACIYKHKKPSPKKKIVVNTYSESESEEDVCYMTSYMKSPSKKITVNLFSDSESE